MRKLRKVGYAAVIVAGIAFVALAGGCSKKGIIQEVVATVSGEEITVLELREYLGAPAGIFSFANMPVEQKKEAVDRMVAGRLVVQEGRALGLDKTPEYKETVGKNRIGVEINALFRKEASEKLKLDEKEVQAEAAKIKGENAGISDTEATGRASRAIVDRQLRKIQKDLVVTARKETGAAVDNAALDRIGKGESLPDNAVLASAGSEKILYSDVKKIIREMPMLPVQQGAQNAAMTQALVSRVLDQELILRAMREYAKMQKVDGSEWHKSSQRNMERSVIANMVFDNVTGNLPRVTDEEVSADYAKRVEMMGDKKKEAPPLESVKEQLREVLQSQKRRGMFEEHVGELRKKGKVTVNDGVLPKV